MSVDAFARDLRARKISAVEMTEECLRHIERDNARLNAFILVMAEDARRDARLADADLAAGRDHGPLHGVPVSVKDLFDITGTVTTAASRVRDGIVATADAAAITALRRAGAVIIGKTNLHEFAFGTTNEDSAYGPCRNPHDPSRLSGGSSGGSAVSLVTGMALATLGTDTGGSIRIPAAACGAVGLKPTTGELSTEGVVPLSRSLDHVGPLTHTVTDAWHLLHALRGGTVVKPLEAAPPARLRLGVPRAYFCERLDPDVRGAFDTTLAALAAEGAQITDVTIPSATSIATIYLHIVLAEAAAYHATALETMPERYTVPVRLRLEMARYVLAEDYVRALNGRERLRYEVDAALTDLDALVLPSLAIPAPPIGATSVQVGEAVEPVRNVMLRLTQLFNLSGHPAISLPCGKSSTGLPIGLQLAGHRMQTDALLHVARGVEHVLRA